MLSIFSEFSLLRIDGGSLLLEHRPSAALSHCRGRTGSFLAFLDLVLVAERVVKHGIRQACHKAVMQRHTKTLSLETFWGDQAKTVEADKRHRWHLVSCRAHGSRCANWNRTSL